MKPLISNISTDVKLYNNSDSSIPDRVRERKREGAGGFSSVTKQIKERKKVREYV